MKKQVEIIGVPSDLGANIRGALMGPASVRIAGLKEKIEQLGINVVDSGDIEVPIRESLPAAAFDGRFLEPIGNVCDQLAARVQASLALRHLPIVIGGDHSIVIGSIAGAAAHHKALEQQVGLVWFDAHADLNTPETTVSGNIHGMPLAVALGFGHERLTRVGYPGAKLQPENVALVGVRTIDADEKRILRQCGIRYFTMREIDERGMFAVMQEAVRVASQGTSGVHVSVDVDSIDPLYAPGVSTPVPGGLSFREVHLGLEMLADSQHLCSLDLVELNPFSDEAHKTANLVVELVLSALGKSIV